jgi:hypothetical protein
MRLTSAAQTRRLLAEVLGHSITQSTTLTTVNGKLDKIMADLTALTAAVDALVSEDASVVAELQRLSALVASGGSVSQADLDALTARVQGVTGDIQTAIDADPPA